MSTFLNLIIPAAVIAYAVFVIVKLRKGGGCSHCSGCPMAGKCEKEGKRK